MKTLKLFSLFFLGFLFSECRTTAPNDVTIGTRSIGEVLRTLDSVRSKFADLALSNLTKTPAEIMVMTRDWTRTLPNVVSAIGVDSSYFDIELKSGLRTTFQIFYLGDDSVCLTRGGRRDPLSTPPHLLNSQPQIQKIKKSKNTIPNKKILIFCPFSFEDSKDRFRILYHEGEVPALLSRLKALDPDIEVTYGTELIDLHAMSDYGLVLIDTHGLPDGFYTGQYFKLDVQYDTNETEIKLEVNVKTHLPDTYDLLQQGHFRVGAAFSVYGTTTWRNLLSRKDLWSQDIVLLANSSYLRTQPKTPSTIIVGNMCYSGWRTVGQFTIFGGEKVTVKDPIQPAFLSLSPISYYCYGYDDGTSAILDDSLGKMMEDSLSKAFFTYGDSSGHAYLNPRGVEYTSRQLNNGYSPDLPFKHYGADDYSYSDCIDKFVDARDSEIYAAVCIGNQTWMAENLRYNTSTSRFYNDNTANGKTYGKLYDWATVMQGFTATDANPSKVRGICPQGWHVPSIAEVKQLTDFLGGGNTASKALKSASLWNKGLNGTNSSGFNAFPAGEGIPFGSLGDVSRIWTTSEWAAQKATFGMTFYLLGDDSETTDANPKNGFASCRCLKDN